MRRAETITSLVLAALSLYMMWKSAELPVGWIPDYGPGGGAFPFWLAFGMLICSVVIFIQTILRKTAESRSEAPFLDPETKKLLITISVALIAMVGLIHIIGVYFSIPLFVIFYLRHLGNHSWPVTLSLSVGIPVATFLFFEKLLLILLPKGLTEEMFYIFF